MAWFTHPLYETTLHILENQKGQRKLRETFRAYYALNERELKEIWSDGTIVLDTNALLNFFRYTPGTRNEFLSVLDSLSGALWIPHQVGLEFQSRRLDVINGTSEAFTKLGSSVDTAKNAISKTLNEYKHHPSLNRSEVAKDLDELFRAFSDKLDAKRKDHDRWINGEGDPELIFARISDLFAGRVGTSFTEREHQQIESEGKDRYAQKIPPGYKDAGKSNGNEFGDLIIWKEILKHGQMTKKPLIFVTDDAKEDWWRIERGKTQGPRVELIDEYWHASEQRIHFYEPLQFLRHAKERTEVAVSEDSLEEVAEVSKASELAQRVLRERLGRLEQERVMRARILERRRNDSLSPEERQALAREFEAIAHEQRSIEDQREVAGPETEALIRHLAELDGIEERKNEFLQTMQKLSRTTDLDRKLAKLTRRRMIIERQLGRGSDNDDRMADLSEQRLRRVETELQEVSLALDELEG